MSLKKYIENKTKPQVIFSLESYQQSLFANISSLLLKPSDKIEEVKKQILNISELELYLSEVLYPFSEELQIAIKSDNLNKIKQFHVKFQTWKKHYNLDEKILSKIDNLLYDYQTNLYSSNLNPEDIDKVVESYLCESRTMLKKLSNKISSSIDKIIEWKNHIVKIEGLIPDYGFFINKAKVSIDESFCFEVKLNQNFKVENIVEDVIPSHLKKLIDLIESKNASEKIKTLYMSRPVFERKLFESRKRDVCMGLVAVLPKHITLSDLPAKNEGHDLWKVKVQEIDLYEHLNEEDCKEYQIIDDCSIKWLERVE